MKKTLLASAAAFALCGTPALADGMGPGTTSNWGGFYAGIDAGWQGSEIGLSDRSPVPGTLTYNPHHDSFALGGFIGAQRQFDHIVLGLEGSYTAGFGDQSLGVTPSIDIFFPGGTGTANAKMKDIWSGGARVGWAMDCWMPYITGGYARGSFEFDASSGANTQHANANTGGYYIGGGIDWAVARNWVLGIEYRHYDFDADVDKATGSSGNGEPIRFDPTTDTVMARASYKFDWNN